MTRTEFAKFIAYLTAAVPNARVTPETAEVWFDLLHDLPAPVAMAALRRVLETQEGAWLPMPGAIRRAAFELQTDVPDGDTAWGEVVQAVRQCGYYDPEGARSLLSPVTRQVVDAIGWEAICTADADVVRGQFLRLYDMARQRAVQEGIVERDIRRGALAEGPGVVRALLDRWQDRAGRLGLPDRGPTHEA